MIYISKQAVSTRLKALLERPVRRMPHPRGIALAFFLLLALATPFATAAEQDPLEPVNRVTHKFNRTLDRFFLNP